MERRFHNRYQSLALWPLLSECQYIKDTIQAACLTALAEHTHMVVDRSLISAFVEQWHLDTNTFHLPFGEMTITGDDVFNILDVKIEGRAVKRGQMQITTADAVALVHDYLGVDEEAATNEMVKTRYVSLVWLRNMFKGSVESDSQQQKEQVARAFILHLLGTTLCPNKTGDKMHVQYLACLTHLGNISGFSWGSTALILLYRELGIASRYGVRAITDCMTLLQIYKHFPTVGLCVPVATYEESTPRLCKWIPFPGRTQIATTMVVIRQQFDALSPTDVIWDPYQAHRHHFPFHEIAFYIGLMVCFEVSESIYPGRVLRQFGRVQSIQVETYNCRCSGSTAQSYKCDYHAANWHWDNWGDHCLYGSRRSTLVQRPWDCTTQYMPWYTTFGHPHVLNPALANPVVTRGIPATGKFARRLRSIINMLQCCRGQDMMAEELVTRTVNLLEMV